MSATQLPSVPSILLRVAIADARALDHKRYLPDSGAWHRLDPATGRCHVCLAGACIAGTLAVAPGCEYSAHDFESSATRLGLYALDYLRRGHLEDALLALRRPGRSEAIARIDGAIVRAVGASSRFGSWIDFNGHLARLDKLADELERVGH